MPATPFRWLVFESPAGQARSKIRKVRERIYHANIPRCQAQIYARETLESLAHGRSTALAGVGFLGLGLGDTLGEDSGVLVLRKKLGIWESEEGIDVGVVTYGSILGLLRVAALESQTVALVLEALGGDEALDLGGLGVWLLALALGLDFTTDDELADLESTKEKTRSAFTWLRDSKNNWLTLCKSGYVFSRPPSTPQPGSAWQTEKLQREEQAMTMGTWWGRTSSSLVRPKNLRILVARLGPRRLG